MRKALFILLIVISAAGAFAQGDELEPVRRPDFIISGDLSSGLSLFSLGFEKLFFLKPNFALAAKIGFGYNQEFNIFSTSTPPTDYFIMPHHLTCNFGKNKSMFELGAGASLVSGDRNTYYLVYPILGYRFHPFNNPGFSFRVFAYFPFGQKFVTEINEVMFAPIGLSFGVAL